MMQLRDSLERLSANFYAEGEKAVDRLAWSFDEVPMTHMCASCGCVGK